MKKKYKKVLKIVKEKEKERKALIEAFNKIPRPSIWEVIEDIRKSKENEECQK